MSTPRRLLPSTGALLALEAFERLGSISGAARDLALTQGAVSRQIQALEAQLGVPLTERDGRRVVPTPAARAYAAEVRRALDRIAQAALKLQVAEAGGALNLAILPAFGMRWLMPRLPDFARRHPDVTINMATRLEPFNFATEAFDAAIHFGAGDWPGTERLLLRHESVIAVAAPDLLARTPMTDPRQILSAPLLHIRTRPKAWANWFQRQGVTAASPLPGTLHDQFSTITQAALLGLGIALLPEYLVEQEIAARRLVPVFGGAVEAEGAYYLVWPKEKSHDLSLRRFRDWLATQVEPEDPLPR